MIARISTDETVAAAIEHYLLRLEQGNVPDKEAFLSEYPDCALDLREAIKDLDFADSVLGRSNTTSIPIRPLRHGVRPDADCLPRVSNFRLIEQIGRGRQGIVYQAEQLGTKRTVALKVIREGAFASPVERRRFENEVQLAARLNHPNIVTVHEYGRDAGREFFAMSYVEGQPLDAYCSGRSLSKLEIVRLHLEICRAVAYAHDRGVLHRDLKPSNVLVDVGGRPHILDFGLAKSIDRKDVLSDDSDMTQIGDFAGTWAYASPEQAARDPGLLDVRTDVYALGILLYEMLTGTYPYPVRDETPERISQHILQTPPRPPSQIIRTIDSDLETIVLRALSKDSQRRYQSAANLADDLDRYLNGLPIEAKRDDLTYVLSRLFRRHKWAVVSCLSGLLSLVGITAFVSVLYVRASEAQAAEANALETSDLRLRQSKATQSVQLEQVNKLNQLTNHYYTQLDEHGLAEGVPQLTEGETKQRLHELERLFLEVPENLIAALTRGDLDQRDAAVDWLTEQEPNLEEAVSLLQDGQLRFGLEWTQSTKGFGQAKTTGLLLAQRAGVSLSARALYLSRIGDHESAVESLEAARRLALGMADAMMILQKGSAVTIRSQLYDTLRRILEDATEEFPVGLYFDWLARDPHLTRLGPGLLYEHWQIRQVIEAATRAGSQNPLGYVDLDALNRLSAGLYEQCQLMSDRHRALALSVNPQQMLALLEDYFAEAEQWDASSISALSKGVSELLARLSQDPAWPLVQPMLPCVPGGFKLRGRCASQRAAMLAAASLSRYRRENGKWPQVLAEVKPLRPDGDWLDPYTGLPFAYHSDGHTAVLYSVNEDGVDDGGKRGEWGMAGTDFIHFEASR